MRVFVLALLLVAVSAVPMPVAVARDLIETLRLFGVLPDVATTAADVGVWRNLSLFDAVPDCPLTVTNAFYSCDAMGYVDRLTLRAKPLPADTSVFVALGYVSTTSPANATFTLFNFVGAMASVFFDRIHIENSLVLSSMPTVFPLRARFLTLANVTFGDVAFLNDTGQLLECSFTNVSMPCPVPQRLWKCFSNATTPPPCTYSTSITSTYRRLANLCGVSYFCNIACLDPVAAGFSCPTSTIGSRYFPAAPGFSVIEFTKAVPGEAEELRVTGAKNKRGFVTRVELFDWRASPPAWKVAYDRLPVRELGATEEVVDLPPILTNRARVTFEQWFSETDAIGNVYFDVAHWPDRAPPRKPGPLRCPTATSTNERSMLDETIGDSFCLGRVCQLSCSHPAANFTFQRTVRAQFLVIEGGELWSNGRLVATPSDETRVYRLDGNETSTLNAAGVGDVRRVRLVGDPLSGALPAPTLPNRLGLPGVLTKRLKVVRPNGGVMVDSELGRLTPLPNETIVSAVTVLNQTFATTTSGRLWRHSAAGWNELLLDNLSAIVLNRGESAPARKLATVGGRLVVVIATHTNVHDGSTRTLLVNRRLAQTPVDLLDVASGVWYNEVLTHGIERNVSDIDVVAWNTTVFGVADRASGATAVFEWRPFPYELRRCAANGDCQTCLTNEANEEPCRWCGARCLTRQASCMGGEMSIVNASAAACVGLVTGTSSTTLTITSVSASTANATATTLPSSSMLASFTSLAGSSVSSTTIGLAVGVPFAVLAAVTLLIGVCLWSRSGRKTEEDGCVELPEAVPIDGAYSDVRDVRDSAYEAPDSKLVR